MSEYQYYEFLAVDRPLTSEEMSELRKLSTRADITPVSFVNEYHWGDFKGDPNDLMHMFFDLHVYLSNWMTAIFMVRLPFECLSPETAEAMAANEVLYFESSSDYWVITWRLEEGEDYDRLDMGGGEGWMSRLAPVREELLRGDIRSLYVGWLSAVTWGLVDDDELEPLPVKGLGNLTEAQKDLAGFLEVDPDLMEGAGIGSPPYEEDNFPPEEMDNWLDGLPDQEVKGFLRQLLFGQGQRAERAMRRRFLEWRRGLETGDETMPRRSVKELKKNRDEAEKRRIKKEKERKARLEAKRRKEREAYLTLLAKDFEKVWTELQQTVPQGTASAYDRAKTKLVDLAEAYALFADIKDFKQRLEQFMLEYKRRRALIQRLEKAGIWPPEKIRGAK